MINNRGHAIALNAGGQSDTASSYYLPLDRVVRALSLLVQRAPVPRGCVGAKFTYEAFHEVVRLGLQPSTVLRVRTERPDETGMLRVDLVRPLDDELQHW